ncbi:NAD(P)-binding protein [Rozella allomycis CSF55]|uniref:NAD(P)-binding protein n=1 Tax=Rozella allomycis (strain CSF55) TaxID=988480 RepID=A0A4P9YK14_ROZAC|nr:NAD(P)-binding protein [Rozella allomycis CSF55]
MSLYTGFLTFIAQWINNIQFLASACFGFVVNFFNIQSYYKPIPYSPKNAIIITGCSSGIGFETSFQLAYKGFMVIAVVRKREHADILNNVHQNICPILCDVQFNEQINTMFTNVSELLRSKGANLVALIHNAGSVDFSPMECTKDDYTQEIFDTMIKGPYYLSKKFMPMLRSSGGRIVIVGSILGFSGIPLDKSMAKGSMEMMADCLRRELRPHRVSVSLVQPGRYYKLVYKIGAIKSRIWGKMFQKESQTIDETDENLRRIYSKQIESFTRLFRIMNFNAIHPMAVTRCIEHAVTSSYPMTRYLVGLDACIFYVLDFLPARFLDSLISFINIF